ncbi:NADPH-dependent F420 reductase [Paenibacillus sp. S-38]|uniref:NADPH-dependent F420 reductase n=1 Tax=Paenibacillus sp. S-38 TaxID=3416710 RepID=UPI003CF989C8
MAGWNDRTEGSVSVIGTGRMGKGLAARLHPHLKGMCWGSRSKERAARLISESGWEEGQIRAVGLDEAMEADILIPAMWLRDLLPWAEANGERLAGKILVDITNPFTEDFSGFTTAWGTSAAEQLQKVLPRTQVVGAFKNTFFRVLEEPLHQGLQSDVYVTGDDEAAKRAVMKLLQPLPFRVLDAGRLENNRTIERMTLFERELAVRYGSYPYVSFRLFGVEA